MKFFRELWNYREMINSLVKRDLKSRYKGSVLGVLWMFMDPLLQLVVYSIVFSTIMPMGIDKFYLFLSVTLIPWIFFSTCLTGGTGIILGQQDMVKKIYFPREVLPIVYTTANFVNMLFSFVVVFVVIAVSRIGFNPVALIFLPLVMIIEYMLSLGITLFAAGVTVYFRDFQHIFGVLSLAWMYLTPVIYPSSAIPEKYRTLFFLNPMTPVSESYRSILYYKAVPELKMLLLAFVSSFVVMVFGFVSFGLMKRRFVEEL